MDKDKNLAVDQSEIGFTYETLGPMEPCIYGFLQACDQGNKTTFDGREWEGCFPLSGELNKALSIFYKNVLHRELSLALGNKLFFQNNFDRIFEFVS